MTRARLDTWCEGGIFGLVLMVLMFGPLALGGVRGSEFLVLQGLTFLAVLLWLLRIWINPQLRLLWPPICWGVLAFAVYAIGRYWFADIEYVAREELTRVLLYVCLFFVGVNNLHRHSFVRGIVFALVFLAFVEGAFAVYQFVTQSPYIWHFRRPEGYLPRGSGTYFCPNHLAGFLDMILPLGLAATVMSRFKPVPKVFLGYASLVAAAGIVVSLSRGGWTAAGLGLAFMLAVAVRSAKQWLGLALLVALLAGLGVLFYGKSIHAQKRGSALSQVFEAVGQLRNDARYVTAATAYRMWRDHFWTGVGPAHFDHRFHQYRGNKLAMGRPGLAHNDYLNLLVDWGMAGGGIVFLSLGVLGWSLARYWRRMCAPRPDSTRSNRSFAWLVVGATAGLVAIAAHSVVDFNLHIPANAILAVTLVALLSAHLRFATERYWVSVSGPLRGLATLVLLAALLFLGVLGSRRAREEYWLRQAQAQPVPSAGRLAALERAFAVEPLNPETCFALGETLRLQSGRGEDGYRELGERALGWFRKAAQLNPWEPGNLLRQGACLDWLERHEEALPCFTKALALDPNGYLTLAQMGWHYFQVEDYAAAIEWFNKSLYMHSIVGNTIPAAYLPLAQERLAEQQKKKAPPNK